MQIISISAHAHIKGYCSTPSKLYIKGNKIALLKNVDYSRTVFCERSFSMSHRKTRVPFEYVSEFDSGRIFAYKDCALSFREIGLIVGRSQATLMLIWNCG